MSYVTAFWVGGLICALCQILLEKTKLMPGRVMVILVCSGALLGAFNIYQPFVEFAGAGASVPLLGFGNVLWKGVKEAVDENGFLGIFMGGFKASAVGISAALIFSYLASLIFQPKMKRAAKADRRKMNKKTYLIEKAEKGLTIQQYLKQIAGFSKCTDQSMKFTENGICLGGAASKSDDQTVRKAMCWKFC